MRNQFQFRAASPPAISTVRPIICARQLVVRRVILQSPAFDIGYVMRLRGWIWNRLFNLDGLDYPKSVQIYVSGVKWSLVKNRGSFVFFYSKILLRWLVEIFTERNLNCPFYGNRDETKLIEARGWHRRYLAILLITVESFTIPLNKCDFERMPEASWSM